MSKETMPERPMFGIAGFVSPDLFSYRCKVLLLLKENKDKYPEFNEFSRLVRVMVHYFTP